MFHLSVLLSSVLACSAFKDYGIPGWTCEPQVMKRSAQVPTSVHSLRFADIDVIGSLGDSLTAGNGAGALDENDRQALPINYRGLVFSVGGDSDLSSHVSLANILKKFNPNLYGYSIGSGLFNDFRSAQFNAAVPGAKAINLTSQARDLVQRMRDHPDKVDIAKSWKLIHIFIGGNDACDWCGNPQDETADLFEKRITDAIQYLKENLPRTIVVITGMMDITVLRDLGDKNKGCNDWHAKMCPCVQNKNFTTEQLRGLSKDYIRREERIQSSGLFDTSDDFTVVVLPFLENNSKAPLLVNGSVDLSLFAPDCFHFSAYGHAVVGKNLWNNLLQSVPHKPRSADLSTVASPLYCPNPECPFIRTTKNSFYCGKYLTSASQWR